MRKKKQPARRYIEKDDSVLGETAPVLHDLMTTASGMRVAHGEVEMSPTGWTKCYYVTALPSRVRFQYLRRFFQIGADVHVTMHIDPADSARAINKRTRLLTRLESEIIREQKSGTNKQLAYYQMQYQMLEAEREMLRSGQERLLYVTLVFAVSSSDREEFDTACDRIEREGFEGFVIRDAFMEHDLGLKTVAPIGVNALRHPIEMTSSAVANAFPFTNSRFSHEYGVPIGIDFSSGHLNRYDAWNDKLVNANAFVIGTSGAGKSYLIKGLVARSAAFGVRHAIVDYEGEYTAVVQALGGVSMRVDERSPSRFNPFELEEEEELLPDGSVNTFLAVREKISEMERLIHSMVHLHAATDQMDGFQSAAIN